jgi:hypothetical protein
MARGAARSRTSGAIANKLCASGWEGLTLSRKVRMGVDAVEKVHGMPSARNNRIMVADFLNRSCAFDACCESILLGVPPQNPFSTASVMGCRYDYVAITTGVPQSADDLLRRPSRQRRVTSGHS